MLLCLASNVPTALSAQLPAYITPMLTGYVEQVGENYLILENRGKLLPLLNIANLSQYNLFLAYAAELNRQVKFFAVIVGDAENYQVLLQNPRLVPKRILNE